MSLSRIGKVSDVAMKSGRTLFCRTSQSGAEGMARTYDEAREVRIRALTELLKKAIAAGSRDEAYRLQAEWKAAILARSPEQIARMERAQGAPHA